MGAYAAPGMCLLLPLMWVSCVSGCSGTRPEGPPLTSGVSPPPSQLRQENWNRLTGTWYGSQPTKDGGVYHWIIRHGRDGTYRLVGKSVDPNGQAQQQVEVGLWGAGTSIYFTIFRGWVKGAEIVPSDPSDPYHTDIYRIGKLSDREFHYQHADHDESFRVEKVPDDFHLP